MAIFPVREARMVVTRDKIGDAWRSFRSRMLRWLFGVIATVVAFATMRIHAIFQWENGIAEDVKAIGGAVEREFGGPKWTPQSVQLKLPWCQRIREITLIGEAIPPKLIGEMGLISMPESIWLGSGEFRDADLIHLKGLTTLQRLDLRRTSAEHGVEHLKDLTNLEFLDLNYTKTGDAGLLQLKKLKRLKSLGLYETRITDAGLKAVSSMTNLERLQLGRTQITDAGLESVAALKKLEVLEINETSLTDASLVHLKGLTKLKSLNLSETQISDSSLPTLLQLKNLELLRIGHCRITAEGRTALREGLPLCKIKR